MLYILLTEPVEKGVAEGIRLIVERENFMLVSGVSFSGCENFFENKRKDMKE